MKRLLLSFSMCFACMMALAQAGYRINVTLKPYKNQYVYLGYYYGKLKALADSALLDNNSSGVLTGKEKLPGGIYFLVSPRKEILFELLLDKQQNFSVTADTAALPGSIVFTGSADNTQFQSYSKFTATNGAKINALLNDLKSARSKADSLKINDQLQVYNKQIQQYRSDLEAKQPNSMLAAIFRAMKEPVVPPADKHPKRVYDSTFAYNYYKGHYWSGVSFSDERLIRTPIFEPKLEKYYKELVVPDPDSLNREIDGMLQGSESNKEMFKYLLTYFVQKYINPEYMGQDAVFVHLFEKYINNNKQVDWFTEKYNKYMFDRAYSLMANLIGSPAYDLNLADTSGKTVVPLYSLKGPFTVVCFWDATCSHCKEIVPKVDSIFQAKWKKQGIQLYGVMVDGGKEAWINYLHENKLKDWVHVYETSAQKDSTYAAGKPNFRQLYDVSQTPMLYLLDKDKRIIAKKLTYLQIDEIINLKSKTAKSDK
ncbi:MAG: DUF5106 domain-containing protein [Williamsia sp.]|nr:DUF5106 domain-containing protein [Williamsia sp.]